MSGDNLIYVRKDCRLCKVMDNSVTAIPCNLLHGQSRELHMAESVQQWSKVAEASCE